MRQADHEGADRSERAVPDHPLKRGDRGRFARQWELGDIIRAAQRWREEHGVSPRAEDWAAYAGGEHPSARTVFKRFRSWKSFLRAAGMARVCTNEYCEDSVYQDGTECHRCAAYRRRTGTAWAPEGLRVARERERRRREAIAALRAYSAAYGHPPTVREYIASGYEPSRHVIQRAFGSWSKAVESAFG